MKKIRIVVAAVIILLAGGYLIFSNISLNIENNINKNENKQRNSIKDNQYEISKVEPTNKYDIYIEQYNMRIKNKNINRWVYTSKSGEKYDAGMPIITKKGSEMEINVYNNSTEKTNIHWHGLNVDNNQDGPGILIEPGSKHKYNFKIEQTGTFWYHSHERPVRDQVDNGMYAPFIVKDSEDEKKYNKDYIMLLDDWGDSQSGMMQMEKIGDIDTLNGKTGSDIKPIELSKGELQKLRFINSSTALYHKLIFPIPVAITHTDGSKLSKSYITKELTIAPGERYDIELTYNSTRNETLYIKSERNKGIAIPIIYNSKQTVSNSDNAAINNKTESTSKSEKLDNNYKPDIRMTLSDRMGQQDHEWTINDEVFPNGKKFNLDLNKEYSIRFENKGMHSMEHPMHIHGNHFEIVAVNGIKQTDKISKDTISVPPNGFVDIKMKFSNPGEWMVHCHILDHEDKGMMTSFIVK